MNLYMLRSKNFKKEISEAVISEYLLPRNQLKAKDHSKVGVDLFCFPPCILTPYGITYSTIAIVLLYVLNFAFQITRGTQWRSV